MFAPSLAFSSLLRIGFFGLIVPNLGVGPPADPLPPVRANSPSAAEMASHPRAHPYLFFDATTREALRAKAQAEPFLGLSARIRANAEADLKRPIPPLAQVFEGIPVYLPDGSYNPEALRHNYDDFYHQAYIVKDVIPTLGFAYQLTGDRRFGEAGRTWLLNYARRAKLARKEREADFDAAYVAYGLSLGYDWLWELLTASERREVQGALVRLAHPIATAGEKMLHRSDPQRSRTTLGNNHPARTHGLFGLTPLALLYEVPEAASWLDMEIKLHRDRLCPSAWAPDGEYVDAWDHFESSLDDPMPFLVALKDLGGENLFGAPSLAPRYRGIAPSYLYGLEGRFRGASAHYGWLALARELKDPVAQWIATQDGGLRKIDPIFAYLFYDPAVRAAPPVDPPGSVYFAYSGMVKMCTDWGPRGLLVPFRCGPEIGKDVGDQNGFRVRAAGEWLVPRLAVPLRLPEQPVEFQWDLEGWFRPAAQSIVVPEPGGIGDFAAYEKTGKIPLKGGLQSAVFPPMKGRAQSQWLSGPEIAKNGDLRVVSLSPALDYVCGEAHRAYLYDRPALWVRHLLFVKPSAEGPPPYVLICDEVESGAVPKTFAWQLMSGFPLARSGNDFEIQGKRARLQIRLLAPTDDEIFVKQTPAPRPEQRTPFLQWRTPGPAQRCFYLAALVPEVLSGEKPRLEIRAVPAAGGWAVEVRSGKASDLVLFRADGAKSVAAGSEHGKGTALVLRRSSDGQTEIFSLGENGSG